MEAYNYNYQQIQIPNNYPIYENSINQIKTSYINHSNNGSYNYTNFEIASYAQNQSDKNFSFLASGIRLIQSFHGNGGKRAVYAGTCGEYEPASYALKEAHPLATKMTNYAFCKAKLHEIAEQFCHANQISFANMRYAPLKRVPTLFAPYFHTTANSRISTKVIEIKA